MNELTKETTYKLIKEAQSGSVSAKEKLIESNMGLVTNIAKRFYGRGYDVAEINQLGAIGLIRAIDNFNTELGLMFSTYAVPVILGEIKRFLRDDGPVKVSRSIKETALKVSHFVEQETKKKGVAPKILDISSALGITPEEIITAKDACSIPCSINSEVAEEGKTLEELLKSDHDENLLISKIDIKIAINSLTEREKSIVIMRYFMDKTQSYVAKKIGISQVQVSRLEKKILTKLKNQLMCEN